MQGGITVNLDYNTENHELLISVVDTGIGISEAD